MDQQHSGNQTRATKASAWLYDAASGLPLGPASEEEKEAYMANGGRPMTQNRHGGKMEVVVKDRQFFSESFRPTS
jgi:hypothetical protein